MNTVYLFPDIHYFSAEPFGSEPTVKTEIKIKNPKGKKVASCYLRSESFWLKRSKEENKERLYRMIMLARRAVYETEMSLRKAFKPHGVDARVMYPTGSLTTYFRLPQKVSFVELTEVKEKELEELFSKELNIEEFVKKQDEILMD